jgi:guanylate kinase
MIHTPAGQLFIIAAPSGAGKTSLVSALLESVPDLQVSISHTTRPKRPTEENGTNYFFVDERVFLDMQAAGDFLESAKVFGNYYGTSRKWVNEALHQGIDVILEIDWQGARLIRELMPHTVGIFILPPSMEVLQKRLTERAADDQAVIESRMTQAAQEISHYGEFDYLVVNDVFEQALDELKLIIESQRLKTKRQELAHRELIVSLLP